MPSFFRGFGNLHTCGYLGETKEIAFFISIISVSYFLKTKRVANCSCLFLIWVICDFIMLILRPDWVTLGNLWFRILSCWNLGAENWFLLLEMWKWEPNEGFSLEILIFVMKDSVLIFVGRNMVLKLIPKFSYENQTWDWLKHGMSRH